MAGLVLGCAWTVYANIFAAGVYPSVGNASFDAPVVKRPVAAAARPTPAFNEVFASLTPAPVAPAKTEVAKTEVARTEVAKTEVAKSEAQAPSLMFNDRFAAASPEGVASSVVADAASQIDPIKQAAAPKAAEAARAVASAELAETSKPLPAPKSVETARKQAAANLKVALNDPAANVQPKGAEKASEPKPAEAKQAAKSSGVRDMAARAKAAVMSIASSERATMVEKLWGKRESGGGLLSFASADANVTGSIPSTLDQNPMLGGSPPYDRQTAVYDISAKTVYLPDGTRLEAHSGLGSRLDDPRSSHMKMVGVTPPHIYELKPREALFHGVPALRLNPIGGEGKIFNRDGLLAHTFMLGPNGDSNGCVSFKDYYAFLDAYRNKGIRRLAVLARVQ
ncbi:tlde1 domain-containing protein [Bradyrhizobium acaciae]|uniref:tlde1 domain-containing protein n=1 Tax=Bradyrhizobium acaciae TaxID=2683706 RepID=UPI0030844B71